MRLSLTTLLEDFVLVTYAVPAGRLRSRLPPQLPSELELQTFHDLSGEERAFVSTACFFSRGFGPNFAPAPKLDFYQCTYRMYCRYRGRDSVYFFRTDLGTWPSFLAQRSACIDARHGSFAIERERGSEGEVAYSAQVHGPDNGHFFLRLTATEAAKPRPPFKTGDELAQFLTYRLHGILRGPGGILLDQIVRHARMSPREGAVQNAYFEFWESLGILTREEMLAPYSVLAQPEIRFYLYPPFPMRLLPRSAETAQAPRRAA